MLASIMNLENVLKYLTAADVEKEQDKDGKWQVVRSENNDVQSLVRFTNVSKRAVNISWMDFSGKPIFYRTLLPTQFVDINTYTSHPWIFQDTFSRERYVINNKKVFRGTPSPSLGINSNPTRRFNFRLRTDWNITAPLRNLKSTALFVVSDLVKDSKHVSQLELPKTLEIELKESIKKRKAS